MGAVSIDTNKKARQYHEKYILNTPLGIELLLQDYEALTTRRYISGDYDASDIIIDLHHAIELAKNHKVKKQRLKPRQFQALWMYHVQGYNYREIGEKLGMTAMGVQKNVVAGCKSLAKIFEHWNYN